MKTNWLQRVATWLQLIKGEAVQFKTRLLMSRTWSWLSNRVVIGLGTWFHKRVVITWLRNGRSIAKENTMIYVHELISGRYKGTLMLKQEEVEHRKVSGVSENAQHFSRLLFWRFVQSEFGVLETRIKSDFRFHIVGTSRTSLIRGAH